MTAVMFAYRAQQLQSSSGGKGRCGLFFYSHTAKKEEHGIRWEENEDLPNPLDSLNTCLLQTKLTLDSYIKITEDQTVQMQHNILDNLSVYEDHYYGFNQEMISTAQEMWDRMHIERTNMLWSKEEYINSMH